MTLNSLKALIAATNVFDNVKIDSLLLCRTFIQLCNA